MRELLLHIDEHLYEKLEDLLMDIFPAGFIVYDKSTQGLEIKREDLKEGEVIISTYFEQIEEEKIIHNITSLLNEMTSSANYEIVVNDYDVDWKNEWKKYFDPIEMGKYVVTPEWNIHKIKNTNLEKIYIEPGMAFGTGHHETTQICGEYIQKIAKNDSICLDIGTGTGILSIIASKESVKEIVAFDIDEEAVKISDENFETNNIKNVKTFTGTIDDLWESKYDIIIINVISSIMYPILPKLNDFLKESGVIIFSGILADEKEKAREIYLKEGYKVFEERVLAEWWGGMARRI